MGCGCKDEKSGPLPPKPDRFSVTCPCGLDRCLPAGIQIDETFTLVPCPRCGQTMTGTFLGDQVYVE